MENKPAKKPRKAKDDVGSAKTGLPVAIVPLAPLPNLAIPPPPPPPPPPPSQIPSSPTQPGDAPAAAAAKGKPGRRKLAVPARRLYRLTLTPNVAWAGVTETTVGFLTKRQREIAEAVWETVKILPLSTFTSPDMEGAKTYFSNRLKAKGVSFKTRGPKGFFWDEIKKAYRIEVHWGGSTGRTVTFGILKEKKHAQAAAEAILKMRANLPKDTPKETFKAMGRQLFAPFKDKERVNTDEGEEPEPPA